MRRRWGDLLHPRIHRGCGGALSASQNITAELHNAQRSSLCLRLSKGSMSILRTITNPPPDSLHHQEKCPSMYSQLKWGGPPERLIPVKLLTQTTSLGGCLGTVPTNSLRSKQTSLTSSGNWPHLHQDHHYRPGPQMFCSDWSGWRLDSSPNSNSHKIWPTSKPPPTSLGTYTLCNCVLDFLTNRRRSVRIHNFSSSTTVLSTGSPLGYVMSPLLFTLLTYDRSPYYPGCHIVKLADNTAVAGLM